MENVLSWVGVADAAAVALFVAAVFAATARIERQGDATPSLARVMAQHRLRWMREMADRDARIADAALLTLQHQGAAFFASATLLAIGGVIALIGDASRLVAVAGDLAGDPVAAASAQARAVWEMKLLFLLAVLTVAFLKFVWSHRLFAYCAILIGATPAPSAMGAESTADRAQEIRVAGEMNIRAGRSFNRGLRLLYFSLAALAWLLGPEAFIVATGLTVGMLYRREFRSETRRLFDLES